MSERDIYTQDQRASFAGTEDYASQNAMNDGMVVPEDDFQSLCYTLYALEIGEDKWVRKVRKKRPSIFELVAKSDVISKVYQLWEQIKKTPVKRKVELDTKKQQVKRKQRKGGA